MEDEAEVDSPALGMASMPSANSRWRDCSNQSLASSVSMEETLAAEAATEAELDGAVITEDRRSDSRSVQAKILTQ